MTFKESDLKKMDTSLHILEKGEVLERLSVIEKTIDRIEILLAAFSDKVISDAGFKTEVTGNDKCSVCGNWMMSIRQNVRFTCGHE